MDSSPPSGVKALTDFVERLRAAAARQVYDWRPTTEPPPPAWDRRLKPAPPPPFERPAGDLDEARERMRSGIRAYLDIAMPEHMLLIKSSPGSGKTTAAATVIDEILHRPGRIAYAGPRHDFFQDVVAKTLYPAEWYEWQARQAAGDRGQPQTCNYPLQMAEWLQKGYSAMDFCSGVCGWNYVNDGCEYHAQRRRPERVIYVQHQHVALGHPLDFTVLFGDESPLAAFTNEWRIPARWILPPGMADDEPIKEILAQLAIAAGQGDQTLSGPALLDYLGGPDYVIEACELADLPADEIQAATSIRFADQVEDKPYFHLFDLVPLLLREAQLAAGGQDYPHRIILSTGHLTLLLRHKPHDLPPHVIWMDATGREAIYEQVFGRPVQVIDARPRMHGRVFQVVDRANGKTALVKGGKRTAKANQAEDLIRRIISSRDYQRPTVIGFKDFVDDTDLEDVRTGHFYAARGTNEHEDADAVFILGAPQSNIYDVVKMAKMIYFERDQAFHVTWRTEEKAYRYVDPDDGLGRTYPVSGFWNDPDLQAVLETIREDEIVQAAHRGRPVNHPVDIWLLTNVPIDSLPPDELLTMQAVLGAPDGVDIFKWAEVQSLMAEKDEIVISDLTALGMHYETASKYLDLIAEQPGWEKAAKKSRRGKPAKVASRSIIADDIININ